MPGAVISSADMGSERPRQPTSIPSFARLAAESPTPELRRYWLERKEMEDLRADPRVRELMDILGKLRDAPTDGVDGAALAQLFDDAKFAMDVFKTHTSARGITASKFRAYVQLSLINFEGVKAAQKDKSRGIQSYPEHEVYRLLVQVPSLRGKGQLDPKTGQLQFSIDDVIGTVRTVAIEYFDNATAELKR